MSIYQKWSEIKLLAGNFVPSAARNRIVLTAPIRTSQSLRAKEHYSPVMWYILKSTPKRSTYSF